MLSRPVLVTPAQKRVLDFIVAFRHENDGISPTEQEIGQSLGLSRSSVHNLLVRLEERGRITRVPNWPRTLEVIA
jgi:SOS-response transcriptional repressor LexA